MKTSPLLAPVGAFLFGRALLGLVLRRHTKNAARARVEAALGAADHNATTLSQARDTQRVMTAVAWGYQDVGFRCAKGS